MASITNAFAALNAIGSAQAPNASSKKKKSGNKSSKPAGGEGGAAQKQQQQQQNGGGAGKASIPTVLEDAVVDVAEACAILDKAARTFKGGSDRLKLWKDWLKQVRVAVGEGQQRRRMMMCVAGSGSVCSLLLTAPFPAQPPPPRPPNRPPIAGPSRSRTRTPMARSWTSSRRAIGRDARVLVLAPRAAKRAPLLLRLHCMLSAALHASVCTLLRHVHTGQNTSL